MFFIFRNKKHLKYYIEMRAFKNNLQFYEYKHLDKETRLQYFISAIGKNEQG